MAFLRPVLEKAVRAHTHNAAASSRSADASAHGAAQEQEQKPSVIMSLLDELGKQGVDASEQGVAATVERLANQVVFLVFAGAAPHTWCGMFGSHFVNRILRHLRGRSSSYDLCAMHGQHCEASLVRIGSASHCCMPDLERASRPVTVHVAFCMWLSVSSVSRT